LITDTYAANIYTPGGTVSIGTTSDGSFQDIDTTNIAITFTVSQTGRWVVICETSVGVTFGLSANGASATHFRLTDGSAVSGYAQFRIQEDNGAGGDYFTSPMVLIGIFNFTTTGSKTVKLQKYYNISTNVSTRQLVGNVGTSGALSSFHAFKITN